MRRLTAYAFAAMTLAAVALAGAKDELYWESLFTPPYANAPSVMISIACVSKDLCYIPAGSNGNGFGMYSFDGRMNGNFTAMTEPNATLMILAVTAGGTEKHPHGAFGGLGLFNISSGLQYLADDGQSWNMSTMPQEFMWSTQTMSSTHDGQHIMSLGQNQLTGNTDVMHSADGGKTFRKVDVNIPPMQANCTWPNYASMVNGTTWYITLGGYPGEHQNNNGAAATLLSSSRAARRQTHFGSPLQPLKRDSHTSALHLDKNAKTLSRHFQQPSKLPANEVEVNVDSYYCYYTGQVARTHDAGRTWEIVFQTTEYTITNIACQSDKHCVAIGWGATEADVSIAVILTTVDGKTWKESMKVMGSILTLSAVAFADSQEVWVGGAYASQSPPVAAGAFFVSRDGGMTWTENKNLVPNLYSVMDISFADGVGFATAITEFQSSTLLRYQKQSFAGYFTQASCPFSNNCSMAACENVTFPQGLCLESGEGSAVAICTETTIEQRVYNTTACTGPFQVFTQPILQCINSTQGGTFCNFCNTTVVGAASVHSKAWQSDF